MIVNNKNLQNRRLPDHSGRKSNQLVGIAMTFIFLLATEAVLAQQVIPSGLKVALTVSLPKSVALPSGEKELLEAASLNIQLNLVAHVSSGGQDYFCPLLTEQHTAGDISKGAINLNFADMSLNMSSSRSFASALSLIASSDQDRLHQILTRDFLAVSMSCYNTNNTLTPISADIYKSSARYIFVGFTAQNKALESINVQTLLPIGSHFYSQLAYASYQYLGSDLAIGGSSADPSAILDLTSTSKGLLLPRMTTAQRDGIVTPAVGLQIYNTSTDQINFYDGASWLALGVSGSGVTSVTSANGDISVASGTTAPQLTLNSATAGGAGSENKIAKLNASGVLNESLIPSLNATKIGSGVISVSQGGTNSSSALSNNRVMVSSGGAIAELALITANNALVSNSSGLPVASAVSSVELGYLSGVSSNVQTQLDARLVAPSQTGNSGKVLKTNGTSASWEVDEKALAAGSSGEIQFTSGLGAFASDVNLFWADATNRLGVNQSAPQASIHVNGAMVSSANVIASGAAVDLSLSNIHVLNSVGASAIALSNPVSGGNYTIIVADTTSRTYTFSGCSSSYFSPGNGATTSGARSVYGIMAINVSGNWHCYITWSSDFN